MCGCKPQTREKEIFIGGKEFAVTSKLRTGNTDRYGTMQIELAAENDSKQSIQSGIPQYGTIQAITNFQHK